MSQWGFDFLRPSEVRDSALLLRRYLSHSKFSALIAARSLYFAPASSFRDETEGHYTEHDYETWDRQLLRRGFDDRARALASSAKANVARGNRQAVVISCWSAGSSEDLRMWREYGNSSEAVAIETAVGHLRSALGPAFLIIPVTYLDFSKESLPKEHSLQPYFFKRSRFAWEREVRIIGEMEMGKRMGTPRLVHIDLEGIVQRVIVSPYAAPEYLETVRAMLQAASVSIEVHTSAIKNAA